MATHQIERQELAEQATAVVRATLAVSEIKTFLGHAFGNVAGALAAQRTPPAGPPFARYRQLGGQRFDVEAGFPTAGGISPSGEVVMSSLPAGPAAVMTYIGPYEKMQAAYGAIVAWIAERGGQPTGDAWEIYFSDPEQEPDPQKWRTDIVMPFRT